MHQPLERLTNLKGIKTKSSLFSACKTVATAQERHSVDDASSAYI